MLFLNSQLRITDSDDLSDFKLYTRSLQKHCRCLRNSKGHHFKSEVNNITVITNIN